MTQFPSRPAPSWMQEHRGKIVAALAGAITASLAVTAFVGYELIDSDSDNPGVVIPRTPNYPASRDGVRGHVDSDPSVILGVTADPIQPSHREPNYPASRDGVRGHVDSDPSVVIGDTADPIEPSQREPNYPASRDGVRGHVTIE